jgi:hypothetical protein
LDTQHLIAELDAERSRSQRLELQIGELLGQVAALTQKVTELTERLGQNSRNSHRPPSSDPPGTTGNSGSGQRLKSKRPRGGQRGHRGSRLAARGSRLAARARRRRQGRRCRRSLSGRVRKLLGRAPQAASTAATVFKIVADRCHDLRARALDAATALYRPKIATTATSGSDLHFR